MRPVLDSSSFAPVLTLPLRTCLHSTSSVLTAGISCCIITVFVFRIRINCLVIAVFVFRKPLFINKLYHIYVLHEFDIIYSVWYYPRFHIIAVGLGTYYSRIWGHYCSLQLLKWLLTLLSPRIKQLKTRLLDPKVKLLDPEIDVII
jgi:hypothetical protein